MKTAQAVLAAVAAAALLAACSPHACRGYASYGVDDKGRSFSTCDESSSPAPTSGPVR